MWWYMSKYYSWDYRQKHYSEIRGTNQNEILLKASECIRIYPCCETWNLKVTFHWKLLFLIPDHWWQMLLPQISAPCAVSPVNSPNAPLFSALPELHPHSRRFGPSALPCALSQVCLSRALSSGWSWHLCWSLISSPVSGPTSCCSYLDDLRHPLALSGTVQATHYPHPAQESLHCRALVPLALGSPSLLLLCPGRSTGAPSKH